MVKRRRACSVAAVVALALAACGGDEGDEGITKAEFLERAEAICDETTERIQEASRDLDPDDPAAIPDFIAYVSAEVLDEIDQLREVGLPEEDAVLLDQALAIYEERFERWQSEPSAAALEMDDPELATATKALVDYGLPSCGADV